MTSTAPQRLIARALIVALASALTLGMVGCDDEGETESKPAQDKMAKEIEERKRLSAAKKAGTGGGSGPDGRVRITYKNKRWKVLARYFKEYRLQAQVSSKNVFSPNANTFIERPKLADTEEVEVPDAATEEAPPPVKPEKVHGLEAYDLKEYDLVMIVSGTTINRALVIDPKGKQYFIERGFRIGNKGARVQAITQYTLFIQEPDSDKPVKLDIEPPFIGLQSKPDSDEAGDSTVVPKTDLKALFKGLPPTGAVQPPPPGR